MSDAVLPGQAVKLTSATSNETGCKQGVDVVPEVEQVLMEKPVSTPPAK
jgi:hypothetical protein